LNVIIESLQKDKHQRLGFTCGEESLDRFLHASACQASEKNLSKTFVAVDEADESVILGYYTVTTIRIDPGDLPPAMIRAYKLPRIREMPGSLVAKLAVAENFKGQGVGQLMLFDAMARCAQVSRDIGGVAIVVDALTEEVVSFYAQFGFQPFEPGSARLFIMMDTVEELLAITGMVQPVASVDAGEEAG
jgi:GNAT superfamily N-acetyltransferase